jgi:peptide-methionine (S)-S-oxide reductase
MKQLSRWGRQSCAVLGLAALVFILPPRTAAKTERIFLAGGCYWGVEAVFEHVRGVRTVVSGFARPAGDTTVSGRKLRHTSFVETVRIDYDPDKVSYQQLLEIFFLIAHDPTQVDRQGPDVGPQYRSMVFVDGPAQSQVVDSLLEQLRVKRSYSSPIVTEIGRLERFRDAPEDQQDFVVKNPQAPYVRNHDIPMLVKLQRSYPALYR